MIEFVKLQKGTEMELDEIVIKQIIEDDYIKAIFIKDKNGKSYKIKVGDSYSKSLEIFQPKPVEIKRYKLTMWIDKDEDIKKEFEFETEDEVRHRKNELETKNIDKQYEYDIEEIKDERFTVIDEAI